MKFLSELEINPCLGELVTDVIRKRRSIFADQFIKKDIPRHILEEILVNATWAPTHKMTEPWRFIVLQGNQPEKFGQYMVNYYHEFYKQCLPEEELPAKFEYLSTYPLNSACIIAIILVRNKKINLPEWEEIAAISSAVQNIALSCAAYNIGSYWSTTSTAIDYVKELGLEPNEKSLGLFYMGYYDQSIINQKKKRSTIDKKVTWLG